MDSQQVNQGRPCLFYHCIQSEAILSTISLTNISFFTTSIDVIFNLPLSFFCSLYLNLLILSHRCIICSPMNKVKPSQVNIPHLC